MKRIFLWAVAYVLLAVIFTGCTGALKSKTVIIPDAEDGREPQSLSETFEVSKIYKLQENEDGELFGWTDKEHVLGYFGKKGRERGFEQLDYELKTRQSWPDINGFVHGVKVSADGAYASFSVQTGGKEKLMLLHLADQKQTVLREWASKEGVVVMGQMSWSNNGRYVSFAQENGNQEAVIVVYDVTRQEAKEFKFPGKTENHHVYSVQVSDDGASALIFKIAARQAYIVFGSLQGDTFVSQYEHPVSSEGNGDFVNDDQIVFVGVEGSLTLFDRRNAKTTILLERSGVFQLSRDRKYIAYSKGRENLYVAKLQGNNIMNEKEIYKGIVPEQIEWSPDNRRMLLNGRKWYEPRPAVSAPSAAPFSQNNSLFIIEFK
ncbi:hypothetical protein NLX71_03280 [Paenibacillus sp. MZ04-78.2]|uniref:hypothetical protein n=1 Tax=Paenibacillus sp. MZ04-78.2 TaxID=2962034 RepID=UPI0020B64A97|nr:hypothetical protein [Paenibacillus sp. MZ04-78.2]MCP3772337.1 hypothetical protein [Paenibacillus sp. MZ04-78.2]